MRTSVTRPVLHIQRSMLVVAAAASLVIGLPVDARVKVRAEYDKTFPFKSVKTWAWNVAEAGRVVMARTAQDDPEAARRRAEPIILEAVATEMKKIGLQAATDARPDLSVKYFLLLSTNMSSQTVGQFLPHALEWGLPPFPPATQSLNVMDRGSLVLDLTAMDSVVWRGVAEANIDIDADARKREKLLRDSIRDLLKRYPAR